MLLGVLVMLVLMLMRVVKLVLVVMRWGENVRVVVTGRVWRGRGQRVLVRL